MGWREPAAAGVWAASILLASAPASPRAEQPRTEPPAKRQRDAVHMVSAVRPGDPKLADTFEGAVDSLKEGHEVVILFDGKSVPWLRMHPNKGGRTLLEEVDIPAQEREALAQRLGVPPAQAPRNYLEYVRHLAGAGASVFVNRNAAQLFGLAEAEIHPIARQISAREMARILDAADLCYTYGTR